MDEEKDKDVRVCLFVCIDGACTSISLATRVEYMYSEQDLHWPAVLSYLAGFGNPETGPPAK